MYVLHVDQGRPTIPRPAGHPKLLKWPFKVVHAARACTRTVLFRLFVYLTSTYYVVTVKHAVTHK